MKHLLAVLFVSALLGLLLGARPRQNRRWIWYGLLTIAALYLGAVYLMVLHVH